MDAFLSDVDEYTRELDLPPPRERGWVHEVEMPMQKGEAIEYETAHEGSGGRVEFNVHSHQGREITYHVKGTDAQISGTFVAPEEGNFYLLWRNISKEIVRLRVRATRRR